MDIPRPRTAQDRKISINILSSSSDKVEAVLQSTICTDRGLSVLNSARKSVEEDFLLACESGSAQRVREIIASQHIQVKEVWGMGKIGPLHLASGGGHLDVCRILVEEVGVNVNAPTKSFETALHQAAYRGQCEVIEYLLLHGAVIDAKNQYGDTPLFYATRNKHLNAVRLLVQSGASLTVTNKFGDTPHDDVVDANIKRALQLPKATSPLVDGRMGSRSIVTVLSYLDGVSLSRTACVNSTLNKFVDNQSLWEKLGVHRWSRCLQATLNNGFELPLTYRPRSSKQNQKKK